MPSKRHPSEALINEDRKTHTAIRRASDAFGRLDPRTGKLKNPPVKRAKPLLTRAR